VFLDFDGTIMVYDEEPGYFHPEVIALLNRLPEMGVTWHSNSGRGVDGQQAILNCCVEHGLVNRPATLMCAESFVYEKDGDEYIGCEPWNRNAQALLLAFHARVQKSIRPLLKEWEDYLPTHEMYMQPMATFFQLEEGTENYLALAQAFSDALEAIDDGGVVKNGPWIFAQHHDVSKGKVLNHYLDIHQIDPATALAIGDHENDISMLNGSAAGHTGCPGDAIALVKQVVREAGGYVSEIDGPLGTLDVLHHYLADHTKEC